MINVLDYLEKASLICPNKIAFADKNNSVTYGQLVLRAKAAGSFIASAAEGVTSGKAGRPVFVFIDRTIASITAFFGVLYSGSFYVPVESSLPLSRIQLMINTVNPAVLLFPNKESVDPRLNYSGITAAFDEAAQFSINETVLQTIRRGHIDKNPVYAMFTSGTTSTPKGALISHHALIDLVEQFSAVFDFPSDSVFANQAPFDFDVSTKDIFLTIKSMGTMYIVPKEYGVFSYKLIEFLNDNKVNTLIWSASVLRIIYNMNTFDKIMPAYLRQVMFSGEVMPVKILNYWRKYLPEVSFVNLYGPTEITCNCTYYKIEREFAETEPLPVGTPFANTEILLLDGNKQITRANIQGEICVRGACLALGYYGDMDKTSKSFVQNPLNDKYPDKIYRTGDLGCYNERGELMYLGRKDHQIKHMGHRIELSEIEAAVNSLDFIDFACCIYDEHKEKIVLFYQAANNCNAEIAASLLLKLPNYMLPKKMLHYKALPLNKNGKADRTFLKEEYLKGESC